jgi:lysophospholipase L1-like esterase
MKKSLFLLLSVLGAVAPAAAQPSNRLVVVGDSLSAGFQNFSLFTTVSPEPPGGELHGYTALVAQQMGATLTERLISFPGIPPAIELVPPSTIERATSTGFPLNPGVQVTNLSVPGFDVADALAHDFPGNPSTDAIDAMSDLILGDPGNTAPGCGPQASAALFPFSPQPSPSTLGVSEVKCALGLKPTMILVSMGNNDALQALTLGLPPTNPGLFAAQYGALLAFLASTRAKIVVDNIPDVTSVPFLVPVPAFEEQCGGMPAGATDADFVVPNIVNPTSDSFNICMNYAVRSAALIASAKQAVVEYNQIIALEALLAGATVVDINSLVAGLVNNGITVETNAGKKHLTAAYLGGLFSLDAIHPTNTGYAIVANAVINTMNQALHTSILPVSVDAVANADPLVQLVPVVP